VDAGRGGFLLRVPVKRKVLAGGSACFRVALEIPIRGGRAPFGIEATAFVGISTVIANGLLAFGWDVFDDGGNEINCREDFEVLYGVPTSFGTVDHFLGAFVPGHFFQREWRAKKSTAPANTGQPQR